MMSVADIVPRGKKKTRASTDKKAPQEIPRSTIDELVRCRGEAVDYAAAFRDAVKAQAERYGYKPGALTKYVNALHADKIEQTRAEINELSDLLG